MPDHAFDPDEAARTAIVRVFQQVAIEWNQSQERTKAWNEMLATEVEILAGITARANDCYAAARALNFDLVVALAQYRTQIAAASALEETAPMAAPANAPRAQQQVIAPGKALWEVVLDKAKVAYPEPVRAATLQAEIEHERGVKLHFKTVGMSLYRLSRQGLVKRKGQKDWFFVLPEERTKNPDVGASGQEDFGL